MVVNPPPPARPVTPCFTAISAGEKLVRIFDPTRHGTTALTFRANGPRKRFDHHRGTNPERAPCDDPERAIYYAAWSDRTPAEAFSSCFAEIFGDTGLVELGDRAVALPALTRPLHLLDLRGVGAMRAGTVTAITACDYRLSQRWACYFYENTDDFDTIDGISYHNAHNGESALALFERARAALICAPDDVLRLDDPTLRPLVLDIMRQNNLYF
ncbi:MAG TPA: hypothetical protein VFI42_06110 [Thermomicrobiaceae bacterium]|nr:hypothetical protein [Thermomicrobiaceae bacterium]